MNQDSHIPVIPKLHNRKIELHNDLIKNRKTNSDNTLSKDSDVQKVLGNKKVDILDIKHSPTEEEQNMLSINNSESIFSSWLIIILAVIIIILILVIVYFVIKGDEGNKGKPSYDIPQHILHPQYNISTNQDQCSQYKQHSKNISQQHYPKENVDSSSNYQDSKLVEVPASLNELDDIETQIKNINSSFDNDQPIVEENVSVSDNDERIVEEISSSLKENSEEKKNKDFLSEESNFEQDLKLELDNGFNDDFVDNINEDVIDNFYEQLNNRIEEDDP